MAQPGFPKVAVQRLKFSCADGAGPRRSWADRSHKGARGRILHQKSQVPRLQLWPCRLPTEPATKNVKFPDCSCSPVIFQLGQPPKSQVPRLQSQYYSFIVLANHSECFCCFSRTWKCAFAYRPEHVLLQRDT